MVNNTTAAPTGSTSRPDPEGYCRLMAGSEGHPEQTKWSEPDNLWHLGISTTSTVMTYHVTANNTLTWFISLQPILTCYTLSRYNQYYITMIYSATANTTLLSVISSQPILHHHKLSRYSQYYINMIYPVTANITLLCHMSQPLLHYYTLSRAANPQLL